MEKTVVKDGDAVGHDLVLPSVIDHLGSLSFGLPFQIHSEKALITAS